MSVEFYLLFFFFSSRRRHTRFDCDWSSDVCSSDLPATAGVRTEDRARGDRLAGGAARLEHHAGEGESVDRRDGQHGVLSGARQRRHDRGRGGGGGARVESHYAPASPPTPGSPCGCYTPPPPHSGN